MTETDKKKIMYKFLLKLKRVLEIYYNRSLEL